MALQDEELADVFLVGSDRDEEPVPACRFVLAARSKVLKRMLYGSFREAKSSTICMMGYDNIVLQAVVEFCYRNDCGEFLINLEMGELGVRKLVQLAKAADYLELPVLHEQAVRVVRARMTKNPNLACAVFDEANTVCQIADYALHIIECRPYVALQSSCDKESVGGGVECLGPDAITCLWKDLRVEAGELFLFRMLRRWFDHAVIKGCKNPAQQVAFECSRFMRLDDIEPTALFAEVTDCQFIASERIFDAVAKQAIRASQERIWSIQCRGRSSVQRVLVEGAGVHNANGIYYRISGLANGDLYSKREVACGQQYVYTLSCNAKDDTYECRLFCSKLLTDRAVLHLEVMQNTSVLDPVFQPVMQVIRVDEPDRHVAAPIRKYYRIHLSDGEFHAKGTLATSLNSLVESNELIGNSVIKVLQYSLYEIEGYAAIHVTAVSIVSSNPGQCFGSPVSISDPATQVTKAKAQSEGDSDHPGGLQSLYSCNYHVDFQARDTTIPRSGWSVEDDGIGPEPTCVWIPAVTKDAHSSS